LPARIYAHEGICQFLFLKGDTPPEVSYADRKGKYMGQRGVSLPKL
ncbi:MAG: dCTP deaminase, partial [Roseomonas sp.]|nr:dCTP deaminase [Roseomonas sp.]